MSINVWPSTSSSSGSNSELVESISGLTQAISPKTPLVAAEVIKKGDFVALDSEGKAIKVPRFVPQVTDLNNGSSIGFGKLSNDRYILNLGTTFRGLHLSDGDDIGITSNISNTTTSYGFHPVRWRYLMFNIAENVLLCIQFGGNTIGLQAYYISYDTLTNSYSCSQCTTVTPATAYEYYDAVQLSNNKILLVYRASATSQQNSFVIITADGSTVSVGTPVLLGSTGQVVLNAKMDKLTDDTVFVSWTKTANSMVAAIVSVDGSDNISMGTEYSLLTSATVYPVYMQMVLSSTQVRCFYTTGSTNISCKRATISGNTITFDSTGSGMWSPTTATINLNWGWIDQSQGISYIISDETTYMAFIVCQISLTSNIMNILKRYKLYNSSAGGYKVGLPLSEGRMLCSCGDNVATSLMDIGIATISDKRCTYVLGVAMDDAIIGGDVIVQPSGTVTEDERLFVGNTSYYLWSAGGDFILCRETAGTKIGTAHSPYQFTFV